MTTVTQNPPRMSTGIPTGGQFASSRRAESAVSLAAEVGHEHTPLVPLVAAQGRVTIREPHLDRSHPFHVVVVTDDENSTGLHVTPVTSANLVDGLAAEVCRQQGGNPEDIDDWVEAEKAAETWLRQHSGQVAAWTAQTYGARMDPDTDPRSRHFSTHLRLGPDATIEQAVAAAAATRIGEVDEALRTGEFFRRMLDEAPRSDS